MKTTTTKPTQTRPGPVPVVLIRHAQSQWNKENRFTGWADPPLTEAGIAEAHAAGKLLREQGFVFDAAYSSRLQRAVTTLGILLAELGQDGIPRTRAWQLNERHYGALQGLDKGEATARHGEQQVWRWRRGYHDRAGALRREDARHSCHDPLCHDIDPAQLPDVENLAETRERVMRYWDEDIIPRIRRGERLLISAHGNTLRALIMALADMSVAEVECFEIPTAMPIVYHFDHNGSPLDWYYLNGQDDQAA
ncbi:2,3-bisphosphoglycerate-dependent phosphoglycerate mutase [Thiohalophilus sp.]|uniref:2,3-bisphosphoglycerate-dependent phosphoglycerate mutase n=1 Tax=Thiohalophilus sp. TaxID=3028392 RepID=UPI003A103509